MIDDIDSEFLALLGDNHSKHRKSKSGATASTGNGGTSSKSSKPKRKRPAEESASDMDMSSDEELAAPPSRKSKTDYGNNDSSYEDEEDDNPFPLEGKYIDEADRKSILEMNELDREGILGDRQELLTERASKRELKRMVKAKRGAEGGGVGLSSASGIIGDDGGTRTGRERKATGTTTEKRETLEKLKRKREAKGKRAEQLDGEDDDEPRKRERSYDAYTEDGSSEEGEVNNPTKAQPSYKSNNKKPAVDAVGPTEFKDIVLSRTRLAKVCAAPWFGDWVKGAWVRYLVGTNDAGESQYRICQVESIKELPDRTYKFENATTNLQLELRHGDAVRFFPMDAVSNSSITDREFARLGQALTSYGSHLPSVKEAKKLKEQLAKHTDYILTEADLSAILAKKGGGRVNAAQGKAKLLIQRDLARSTGDQAQIDQINIELAKFEAPPPSPNGKGETEADRMKRVNERNRASNREDIKRAENKSQEERRKLAQAIARGDLDVKVDPSARVKTMTRLTYDRDATSRPTTPLPGTPISGANTPTTAATPIRVSSNAVNNKLLEAAKAIQLDIDLDF